MSDEHDLPPYDERDPQTWGREQLLADVMRRAGRGIHRRVGPGHYLLDDGTAWASREAARSVIERHHHALPADYDASSVAGAYLHLVAHPAGVESAIQSLRSLRRAFAAAAKSNRREST